MKRVKNWLVVPSLALVIVVLLALPGVAYAQPPEKYKEFTATGKLTVTYLPELAYPPAPHLWIFKDELAKGTITECAVWTLLEDADFSTIHTSLGRLVCVDLHTSYTEGVLHGSFTIELDGDVLSGRLTAKQEGNLISGPIESTGKWDATERTGIFKQVFPAGEWQLAVEPSDGGWGGTFIWEGK